METMEKNYMILESEIEIARMDGMNGEGMNLTLRRSFGIVFQVTNSMARLFKV